jgi:CheY-like chemotaxis protein
VSDDPEADLLRGARLLLVEDDPDLRETCAEFLASLGAEVLEAASVDEAWDVFQRERPQLVVSDLHMADGDGFELVRRIRELPGDAGGLTPAIAISGTDASRDAVLSGFHVCIAKPLDPTRLAEAVADFTREGGAPSDQHEFLRPRPGVIVLRWKGAVNGNDARRAVRAMIEPLSQGPCIIVSDIRDLTELGWSAPNTAEVALWPYRKAVRHVYVVGGSVTAQIATMGACKLLGFPCTLVDEMPSEALLG